MPHNSHKPPTTAFSAQLFIQLAQMEEAGLPTLHAVNLINTSNTKEDKYLDKFQQFLTAGNSIAEAGAKSGVFSTIDKSLIQAAEISGQLTIVYRQLANYYADKLNRLKKIKSRLYLPALVLTLALFIQPIPLLISSEITAITYLQMSLGRLILLTILLVASLKLPRILESLGLSSLFHGLQLQCPKLNDWIKRRQINQFFLILALMLDAGIDFSKALPNAVASIKNTHLRKLFKPALREIKTGKSVTDTLAKVSVISTTQLQIIHTGEVSGKLASSLLHYSQLEAETIFLQNESLAEWLPRLVYIIVSLWMASSILGSSFSSTIPL